MAANLDVLVVDRDNQDTVLALRALKRAGYTAEFCRVETPAQLHAALRTSLWDVVLCAGLQPFLSMAETVAIIREAAPSIPVIALSGRMPEELDEMLRHSEVAGVVLKDEFGDLPLVVHAVREDETLAADVKQLLPFAGVRCTPLPTRSR